MILRRWCFLLCVCAQVSTAWAKVEATIGPVKVDQNENLAINVPTTTSSEILISRPQYLISYNKNNRAPNWVAWKLVANQIGSSGRSNNFEQDAELETYLTKAKGGFHAVLPTDYKNSCFDRGHQAPSGDRTSNKTDNQATFEMSNMIPQTAYLNRVVWEHLEAYTRDLVQQQGKKVFVIAGPIYDKEIGNIGPNHDIPVPSKDFKIIFILDANQSDDAIDANTQYIAVIMPNILKNGKTPVPETTGCGGDDGSNAGPSTKDDWRKYTTTLRDIENEAGLQFSL
jgi:endonuclease G